MYCTKCGKQASAGDVYCSACGTRLRTEQEDIRRKRLFIRIGTLALAAAIVTAGAVSLLRSGPEPVPEQDIPVLTTQPAETAETTRTGIPEAPAVPETTSAQPTEPTEQNLLLAREAVDENGAKWENTYRYDSSGRIARKQTGDGYVHTYSYRADGTLEKEGISFGDEPTGVILYDEKGNPEKESDLFGDVKTYRNTYDSNNRLITSEKYDSEGILEETYYTYSEDGSYTQDNIDHAEGMMHCHKFTSYNSRGQILTQSQDLESGMPIDVLTENEYDSYGNLALSEYSYDDGEICLYRATWYTNTYSDSGLLEMTEVYVDETQIIRGEVTSYPQKLEKTVLYTYDQNDRLIRQEVRGEGDNWRYNYTWEYDEQGNLISRTEDDGNIRHTYEYLPLEQLRAS